MAHTFAPVLAGQQALSPSDGIATAGQELIYFRALVELVSGDVAGIEASRAKTATGTATPAFRLSDAAPNSLATGHDSLGAWGDAIRQPAAYLVRGDLDTSAAVLAGAVDAHPDRIIIMYDMAALLVAPGQAIDVLLAAKRLGARVLLDNFDLADPPARFMELLPADILRVDPRRMPWHWEEQRGQETMASLVRFADNLLMDVASEDVQSIGHKQELKELGVRYGQGVWRLDTAGVLPDPGSL